jgi:Domain of unknown function (DUF4020)
MKYEVISQALAALAAAHPEVVDRQREEREEDSAWSAAPPTDRAELHQRLTDELASTADALVACEAATSNWDDERRWDQLARAVSAVIQKWPEVGPELLDAVGPGHAPIDLAVVRGWTMSRPDAELASRILDRIAMLELDPILGSVTAMLGGYGVSGSTPLEWFSFAQSEELAKKCWEAIAPTDVGVISAADDFVMMAINHPAGHLAEFWVERIGHLWGVAGDSWERIPPEIADYLAALISDENQRTEVVRIILCRYLYFFHRTDTEWCKQYLLPLLDWDNDSRARKAWSGFLSHGGWTNKLLADGFLEMLVSTISHSDQLDKKGQRNLPSLLAKIAVAADVDPRAWIRDLITNSSVVERVTWARAIRFQLDSLDAEAVEKQWERWMHEYLSDRVSSVPRKLEPAEASAMASWPLFLTDSTESAINLLLQTETAGLELHNLFLHDLGEEQVKRAPEKIAQLIHHLLKSTEGQFYNALEIQNLYAHFKSANVDPEIIRQIAEQAMRLGMTV